jgi:hypothetical protein
MQAVIAAMKRVGPVVAGILKLVRPTAELLHDAGLLEADLRDKRDDSRVPCWRVMTRFAQHTNRVRPPHDRRKRLSLSGENATCTLQNGTSALSSKRSSDSEKLCVSPVESTMTEMHGPRQRGLLDAR